MPLRMTINGRRESFGYYADEIEAPNAKYAQNKEKEVSIRLSSVGEFLIHLSISAYNHLTTREAFICQFAKIIIS
jgi:hypothetical protein